MGWRGSGECEDENNTCSGQLGLVCRGCGTVVGNQETLASLSWLLAVMCGGSGGLTMAEVLGGPYRRGGPGTWTYKQMSRSPREQSTTEDMQSAMKGMDCD